MRDMLAVSTPSPAADLPYTLKADRYSSHAQIARLVQRRAAQTPNEPHVVLDMGCAYGFLRPYLPSPRFYLIGVDISQQVDFLANSDGFIFDQEIVAQFVACGFAIKDISVPVRYFPEASSASPIASINYGLGILWLCFRYFLHRKGIWLSVKYTCHASRYLSVS